MTLKRYKSVTFHENASTSYPKSLDGSSLPALITEAPVTPQPSLELDPMYLTWLRSATKAQYPFIANGTFAKYVYRQNFDQHFNMKHDWQFQIAQEREAAVPALAEKYGSLGWGNLYQKVTKDAWVNNYREIYRFDGSDEQLLEKIAEAYDEIKRTIAEEEKANAQFTHYESIYAPVSGLQWEAFTQGGGALTSPDFGPDGVHLAFDDAADAAVDEQGSALFDTKGEEGKGNEMVFESGVGSERVGNGNGIGNGIGIAMVDDDDDAGSEVRMVGLELARRRLRSQAR